MNISEATDTVAAMLEAVVDHPNIIPIVAKLLAKFRAELVAVGFTDEQAVTLISAFARTKADG